MYKIVQGAEPFLFSGGKTGCLLVHGHTATPAEVRKLGEYLHKQGFTVLGIRLSGHATSPEDMKKVRWQDWLVDVETGWQILNGIVDEIFAVGLSLGGALSLIFASHFPVAGVVAMAAPLEVRFTGVHKLMAPFLPILKHLIPFLDKGSGFWFNPEAEKTRIAYPVNPLNTAVEVVRALEYMQGRLPKITAPVLLIHSKDDDYIEPDNLELIRERLTAADVSVEWLEKANHVVTEDGDLNILFRIVGKFIQSRAA